MLLLRCVIWLSAGLMLSADIVSGQDYPNKPVRIVASGLGGGVDLSSRLIAQGISGSLGQQVIVDNRGGVIPMELVSKAPPDGYTLLHHGSIIWLSPFLRDNVSWDPLRDFLPISLTTTSPNVIVVHPSLPVKSVKELIALAKAKPGALNYYTIGAGSTTHLAAELFKAMAGVNIVQINYRGTGAAIIDLIAGQVQVGFASLPSVMPHVKAGRLRALAVGSAEPSALVPGLPTTAASGVPGYEAASIHGIFAPAQTPATIINRLNQEVVRFLKTAEAKERYFSNGAEAVGSSPEELLGKIKSEMARLGKVIKDAGIKAN